MGRGGVLSCFFEKVLCILSFFAIILLRRKELAAYFNCNHAFMCVRVSLFACVLMSHCHGSISFNVSWSFCHHQENVNYN